MSKLGIEAVVYRNTSGDWNSPTWVACDLIQDFSPNEGWDVAEIVIRRSRVKMGAKTTLDISFTGKMLRDDSDSNYLAFLAAVRSPDATLDLLILDGDKGVAGSNGVRALYQITSNTGSQNPADVLYMDLAGHPYPNANAPEYASATGGGAITFTTI